MSVIQQFEMIRVNHRATVSVLPYRRARLSSMASRSSTYSLLNNPVSGSPVANCSNLWLRDTSARLSPEAVSITIKREICADQLNNP